MLELKSLLMIQVMCMLIKLSVGFYECPVNPVPYPKTSEINNCVKLLSFLKSQGQNVAQWCSVPNNFKQCCITCQNYNSCKNIAYDQSCQEKASQGQCNQIMANFKPVSYFCPKTCGKCSSTVSCNSLLSGCNGGQCYSTFYFSQPAVQCACPPSKGGTYCQETNTCDLSPCMNGGQCIALYEQAEKYTCSCRSGYYGKNCEYVDKSCINGKECMNGGSCQHYSNGSPYCQCPTGYTGLLCENYVGGCALNSCYNGGSCIPSRNSPYYYCVCKSDYTGQKCERKLLCHSLTCQNNGVCRENNGSPYCECMQGFYGTYCQNQQNACTAKPCQNGGSCIPLGTSNYICICRPGFSGKMCQYYTNGCGNTICQNGGTCYLDQNNKPCCNCASGFNGMYCENYIGTCRSDVCLNGGTCIPNQYNGINTCICPAGYIGPRCEHSINCDRGDTNIMQCKNWSSLGFCGLKFTFNQSPIPVYCPISCNMCNQQCYDAVSECPNWALQGLCPSIINQNNGLCRKSCNQCYFSMMRSEISADSGNFTLPTRAVTQTDSESEQEKVNENLRAEKTIKVEEAIKTENEVIAEKARKYEEAFKAKEIIEAEEAKKFEEAIKAEHVIKNETTNKFETTQAPQTNTNDSKKTESTIKSS